MSMDYNMDDFMVARSWPRPPRPFKYVSKKRELRIILKPQDRIIDDQRRVIPIQGLKAEFKNGEYYTDNPVIIFALSDHPLKGSREFVCCDDDKAYCDSKGQVIKELPKVAFSSGSQAMTTGANSTVNKTADEFIAEMVAAKEADALKAAELEKAKDLGLSKEEVIRIIDDRLTAAIGKIAGIIEAAEVNKVKKPKTFTCTVCHKPYTNGVAVGKHMKEDHPDVVRK